MPRRFFEARILRRGADAATRIRIAMTASFSMRRAVFRRRHRCDAYPVLDSTGVACGFVEDIELEAVSRAELQARALLIRADVRRPFWAQRIARLLTRGRIVRVSWSDVRFADGHVALAKPASHYGIETASARTAVAGSG